ncbi:hypothetical protein ASE25_04460 [Terrabacter sp. Root85]|uniref:GmrSD restriction endonuclease domain-containing protein n=1 Tax=Terrabacter sp. Root85 TaxID=1736603 RepID=UPI0006FC8D8A|nr:DUF262 domain-containing protein [Terrabacter sp. Root85]KRC92584.1 hypothetical protein ASE25_04460 [Terrabacter sp. Root85]
METTVRTPLEIFNLPQRLVVPLFQRPYVWTQDEQWEPLWGDIRRVAELRLMQPWVTATHFMGAVVIQAMDNVVGTVQPRAVIDGQQRLTTLQLFIDAAGAVFEDRGIEHLAAQMEGLTHNPQHFVQDGNALKLHHTNRDKVAFAEVMNADPPVDYTALGSTNSLFVEAHRYFTEQVRLWLDAQGDETHRRAEALASVLTTSLQLVVIDLRRDENSQEIFETLNARGTPLTAADLIKNLVFQRLEREGVDTAAAYAQIWPFDTQFWEERVSVGRYRMTRSSLFLNQWLMSRLAEEVGPQSTFTRFKHYVEHEANRPMSSVLEEVRGQADAYRSWTERARDPHAKLSRVELCVYRSRALDSEVLQPLLLWLHEPGSPHNPRTIDSVVASAESWLVRRSLLRLASADQGRVVADLISACRGSADTELADRAEAFLARQKAPSTYWPSDDELKALSIEPAYRRYKRGRLRMYLEAAEDAARGFSTTADSKTSSRVERVGYHIEHILPQRWKTNWPVESLADEIERDNHVHRFGNLTLLTGKLNLAVSNGPWLGIKGKRAKLEAHDVFLLNRRIRAVSEHGWNEQRIDERGLAIVDAFIEAWPVPAGHVGLDIDARASAATPNVALRDLVAAGLLPVGTELRARQGSWGDQVAEVLESGHLRVGDKTFGTPSAAGHHLRKGATNGWWFWRLPDGRRLQDLRAEFLASSTN